jgi:hypothetical protein
MRRAFSVLPEALEGTQLKPTQFIHKRIRMSEIVGYLISFGQYETVNQGIFYLKLLD